MISSKLLVSWLIVSLWTAEGLQVAPRKAVSQRLLPGGVGPLSSRLFLSDENNAEKSEVKTKTLAVSIDDLGQSFKPKAKTAAAQSAEAVATSQKIIYSIKAYCCYMLFILYRAYRGLFILSPAIFRRVYKKLEEAMSGDVASSNESDDPSASDGVSLRTRATVSVLACIVTFSYFLGGVVRVFGAFFNTVLKTTSASASFEAAADELLEHEEKIGGAADEGTNGDGPPSP